LEVSNFVWPQIQDGIMHMSRAQYEALFEGLDWRRMVAKPVVAPAAAG
jgi:transposase